MLIADIMWSRFIQHSSERWCWFSCWFCSVRYSDFSEHKKEDFLLNVVQKWHRKSSHSCLMVVINGLPALQAYFGGQASTFLSSERNQTRKRIAQRRKGILGSRSEAVTRSWANSDNSRAHRIHGKFLHCRLAMVCLALNIFIPGYFPEATYCTVPPRPLSLSSAKAQRGF